MKTPIEIMDSALTIRGAKRHPDQPSHDLEIPATIWSQLRTAIEAQAEELAQKHARIARLKKALKTVGMRHNYYDVAYGIYRGPYTVLAESPAQSAAHLKAEESE